MSSAPVVFDRPDTARAGRLYFAHIPKTAGVTVKSYLENDYPRGRSFVIDEWTAQEAEAHDLNRYGLFSGHYAAEVLQAIVPRPETVLTFVRDPLSRFRSWSAHCRRVSDARYRRLFEGRSEREVLAGPDGAMCTQAFWLSRALRAGADCRTAPSPDELPSLLDEVQIVGVTEDMERSLQLVAYRMGWPAPPTNWHINRRPDRDSEATATLDDVADAALLPPLDIDTHLYTLARERFWSSYTRMLDDLSPEGAPHTRTSAEAVPMDSVREWLRRRHAERFACRLPEGITHVDVDGAAPLDGEGWFWRECPKAFAYRWSGPGESARVTLPPLASSRHYRMIVNLMGAANWPTWERLSLEVNGVSIPIVRERSFPHTPGTPSLVMHARLSPEVVARQEGLTRVVFHTGPTTQALTHVQVRESFDTVNRDERHVGIALHRVRIEPVAGR